MDQEMNLITMVSQLIERVTVIIRILTGVLARIRRSRRFSLDSEASSQTTGAVSEPHRNQPLRYCTARNGQEQTASAIAQNLVTSSVTVQPSRTGADHHTQSRRKLRNGSARFSFRKNANKETAPGTSQESATRDMLDESPLPTGADPHTQRSSLPPYNIVVNEQDEAPTNLVTRSLSVQPSFTRTVPNTRRKRTKRSFRYSHSKYTKKAPPISVAQDPVPSHLTTSSLTTGPVPEMQINRPIRPFFVVNRQEEAAPTTAQEVVTGGEPAQQSLTTGLVSNRQRNCPDRLSSATNGQEAVLAIEQSLVPSGVSAQPSTSTMVAPHSQKTQKRRKRSLRYSHGRKTRKAPTPAVAQDEVIAAENLPPIVETSEEYRCAICLDTTGYTQMKSLQCSHEFHQICIDPWLVENRNCPICREVTTPQSSRHLQIFEILRSWGLPPSPFSGFE